MDYYETDYPEEFPDPWVVRLVSPMLGVGLFNEANRKLLPRHNAVDRNSSLRGFTRGHRK